MNVGEIRAELTKMLGNVLEQTGHPFVSPTDLRYRWITRAANKIPRLVAAGGGDIGAIFGELFATWKAQTTNGVAYLDRPATALLVREVYSFDKTGANADADKGRLIPQYLPERYEIMLRDSTNVGFPTGWSPKGKRLYFIPVPTTAYLTDVHIHGVKRESPDFNSDAQTPALNDDWHEAILFEAARIGAAELGYWERAAKFREHLIELIQTHVAVPAQEDLYDDQHYDPVRLEAEVY